jgi:hypothetical protein
MTKNRLITEIFLYASLILASELAYAIEYPVGFNLTTWNELHDSEAPNDFGTNNELYEEALAFDWSLSELYPYLICNKDESLRGSQRVDAVNSTFSDEGEIWYYTLYNEDDVLCVITPQYGASIISKYGNMTAAEKKWFRIQPVSQSMKMLNGTVDLVSKQLSKKGAAKFTVFLSPGALERGDFSTPEEVGQHIVGSIEANPAMTSEKSFFYSISNTTRATDRIKFWATSLKDGFGTGDACQPMLKALGIRLVSSNENSHMIEFESNVTTPATERQQACVWSILQGITLHPDTLSLAASQEYVPLPPDTGTTSDGSFGPNSFFGAILGLVFYPIINMLV